MGFPKNLVPVMRQRAAAVEQAIADLDDQALWRRPSPTANAPGNLVLHLAGNLMTYIVKGLGSGTYERNRPFEFSAHDLPREELVGRFRDAVNEAVATLERVDPGSCAAPYDGPEYPGHDRGTVALHSFEHLGYHAGQLVLLSKIAGAE